jgi:lipoprotein-releasing system permease protein
MFRPLALFVGLRYTRAKRRNHFISFISLTSMLGITLGVTALITVLSVMNGFEKELRERILSMAAHVSVTGLTGRLADWQEVAQLARKQPHVLGAAPYIEAEAMLIHGQAVSGAIVRGVLPDEEPAVSQVGEKMKAGSLSDLTEGSFGIILGKELAWSIGAQVGDQITLVAPQASVTPAGVLPRLKRFRVVGVFEIGMYEYDKGLALINMHDAARMFQMDDQVSGVRLRLDDMFLAPRVARELALYLPATDVVRDWTQLHVNFFRAIGTEKTVMFIILMLIIAVAAFNIVSTLVMMVTDKEGDIAILRTLGVTPLGIMRIFVVQGSLLGVFGTVLGVIGGVLLALNVETLVPAIERLFGIHFLSPDVYYISELPSDLQLSDVSRIASVAFVLSILATLYPAWRAARVNPAESLRYE